MSAMRTEELPLVDPAIDAPVSPPEERPRHLRAVPPRRRRQPRVALWIGSMVTAVSLFLLVAFNVFMVQGQFDLDHIAQERSIEQNRYEHNRALVASLSAPDTIVRKAIARGLVESTGSHYVQAPPAAPSGAGIGGTDRTATTQESSYQAAKKHLDSAP
jgi:hypothetical protein